MGNNIIDGKYCFDGNLKGIDQYYLWCGTTSDSIGFKAIPKIIIDGVDGVINIRPSVQGLNPCVFEIEINCDSFTTSKQLALYANSVIWLPNLRVIRFKATSKPEYVRAFNNWCSASTFHEKFKVEIPEEFYNDFSSIITTGGLSDYVNIKVPIRDNINALITVNSANEITIWGLDGQMEDLILGDEMFNGYGTVKYINQGRDANYSWILNEKTVDFDLSGLTSLTEIRCDLNGNLKQCSSFNLPSSITKCKSLPDCSNNSANILAFPSGATIDYFTNLQEVDASVFLNPTDESSSGLATFKFSSKFTVKQNFFNSPTVLDGCKVWLAYSDPTQLPIFPANNYSFLNVSKLIYGDENTTEDQYKALEEFFSTDSVYKNVYSFNKSRWQRYSQS